MFKYIFGPVFSSRLGISLGVDLVGANICTFDCLYCESGKTEIKTVDRSAYVSLDIIMQELGAWFEQTSRKPDHITLGGPGEPCLNSGLGDIIFSIKKTYPDIPLAVLTNASMLSRSQVRNELLQADVILPSLDTMVEEEFIRLNRPHPGIRLAEIVQGLLDFQKEYTGKIFLEVLLVPGINDSKANFTLLSDFRNRLRPDRVDITTMSRPGAYLDTQKDNSLDLDDWRREFSSPPVEWTKPKIKNPEAGLREKIAASIKRRPQTPGQLATALGADIDNVLSTLKQMQTTREVESTIRDTTKQKFYRIRGNNAG
ncbi:MAG: radical SAM protein [Desulfonatronovibrio sp.]